MKLLLAELASEGIIQVELKSFTHQQFFAVYQVYLNVGLLKDYTNKDDEDKVKFLDPDMPQEKGPREYVLDFQAELHWLLL